MNDRCSPETVEAIRERFEAAARAVSNGRNGDIRRFYEGASEHDLRAAITALRASQPATPTGGEDEGAVRSALVAARPEINRQLERCRSDADALPYEALLAQIDAALATPTAMAQSSAGSESARRQHAEDWRRQIVSAGGDENIAQQAVALAALNGLFDHIPNGAATPSVLAASREEILQTFDAAYREKMPFHSGHERQVAIEAGIDAILSLCTRPLAQASWQPIETAPKDGSEIIGLWRAKAYSTRWQQYYEKWPHEDGGPTFRGGWSVETWDQSMPAAPSHWMPMPQTVALSSTNSNTEAG